MEDEDVSSNKMLREGLITKVVFEQKNLIEERLRARQTSGKSGPRGREQQGERPEGRNMLCVLKEEEEVRLKRMSEGERNGRWCQSGIR